MAGTHLNSMEIEIAGSALEGEFVSVVLVSIILILSGCGDVDSKVTACIHKKLEWPLDYTCHS